MRFDGCKGLTMTRRIYAFEDGTIITEIAKKGKKLSSAKSIESYNGSPLISIDFHDDFQSFLAGFMAQEDLDPTISIEHSPGLTPFVGVKPGAKVELFRTQLFNKSADKLRFNNNEYKREFIRDINSKVKGNISQGYIHHIAANIGYSVRKCYIKYNDIGGTGGGRLYYKAYFVDKIKNIIHVQLLYTFYKKGQDDVTNDEKNEIIHAVKEIDKKYKRSLMMSKITWKINNILYYIFIFPLQSIRYFIQRIIRKSHMSDHDINNFHYALARQLLPKFLAYKKSYYKILGSERHEEDKDHLGRDIVTKEDIDEIIYALEWELSTNTYTLTQKQVNFYIKYYGKNPFYKHYKINDEIKYENYSSYDHGIVNEASDRAQRAFEMFGNQFTHIGEDDY
jgi:hypothetical protein